jgi:uncharacterized protein (DUF2252 family)
MAPTRLPDPQSRPQRLAARQKLKMARSAHAYMRGNTIKFYEWLENGGGGKAPEGPPVWICGDCHVGNLGPVANADGEIAIQIRDLDQTVIGNPAHDLIRLGLSLATAARGSDLPGVTTALMLEQMMEGYEQAIRPGRTADGAMPDTVRVALGQASKRTWRHLAEDRIEDVKPEIPLGARFWPLTDAEQSEVVALFGNKKIRRLITALKSRKKSDPVKVIDAAYWVKGCSSLGRLRYAVLLRVGRGEGSKYCLIDIKEAIAPAAPFTPDAVMPQDNAERVVEGARHLSPHLGERILAASFLGRSVFLRELMPQDLKLEIEHISHDEAVRAAHYLGKAVGLAHARQMTVATRRAWLKTLRRGRPKDLDAPSWLWSSIVELIVSHEAGYLEHCRRYALGEAA